LEEQWDYFQWAVKLARVNGCIYMDNVVRELLERESMGEGATLITKVGRDGKVMAIVMSVVSSQNEKVDEMLDGFLLAVVKETK
jgi:predicted O-methyltransferase YrrM